MSHHSISPSDKITFTSFRKNEEEKNSNELLNRSHSYSIPTSSLYYESDSEKIRDLDKSQSYINTINIDSDSSKSQSNNTIKAVHSIVEAGSEKSQNSTIKFINNSTSTSLQNNIHETSTYNNSESSPITRSSITNEKILPPSISSSTNKRKSVTIENKSEFDSSSVIVEINDPEEEIINIEKNATNSLNSVKEGNKMDNNLVSADLQTEAANLKKKIELAENRVSIATSGDFTYVGDQPQTPRDISDNEEENENNNENNNNSNNNVVSKSNSTSKNLKRMTDTTSVPPNFDEIENTQKNLLLEDKETADLSSKVHKICIDEDEDEDNTCAICLIETQKPSDIENLNGNNDGSNETVVGPSKEDIDNYECKLHCMHKFHYSCIAQWLERSQNCPICRMEIKHYEIEAIEKRFDIQIKVKEEIPLIQPHYNTSLYFDTELSVDLVKNYMNEHFPWVNFKGYFYTKFIVYYGMLLGLTLFGFIIYLKSVINAEILYSATCPILITLAVACVLTTCQLIRSIIKKEFTLLTIIHPSASYLFYFFSILNCIMLFSCINNFVIKLYEPFSLEEIFHLLLIVYYVIMLGWCCVEARCCLRMYQEDDRRRVDADVQRRNQEIINRTRQEDEQEREEFERTFGHLND
ncbi:hypothetical protein BCR32DRAFT_248100 [Anaeromyces robustus]|uniref:RING-type domain-containing protein n=1 Tax=Anaeromyces robustus TaxID=1754192 RepID=A0A1Y1WV33_9FUNG|nr:hypothetical protein BCR32DRAFT_248100 [Anaeromyces robustus]|eukprot:ORX77265.1 hypothetical protein BCR32DRAFT_248100 [Anaeromyces robustus]